MSNDSANDDTRKPRDSRQAHQVFDDSPSRFRNSHVSEDFSSASGVLFEQAMAQTRMAICLVDPDGPDQPIVFANRAFRQLTGYDEEEVIGRNCRFLQGPGTDPEQVAKIRHAIENENVVVVELLNYRKDGSTFWNALHLGPIYGDDGRLIYFFGSQWDVSDVMIARADEKHAKAMARELSHRMKNMFSVIGGIVSVTGRLMDGRPIARRINERIHALARAYEPTLDEASHGTIEVGQAIKAVLAPYDVAGDRIAFRGNGLRVDPNVVSTLGLALHELATNAHKYGALSNDDGQLEVDWFAENDEKASKQFLVVEWAEKGGPAIEEPPAADEGTGFNIIDTLLGPTSGELRREWDRSGLQARLRLPVRHPSEIQVNTWTTGT
ncbi:signal transduction histidine kinase [Novosphingobium marinum]|uniref:histidine kinase n=1 Tax=Novosphingobium marinum TaxID=1514948 RepID=A0A7Y9XTB9_9SPHN|nr:PAS domain-containing protein [Novosphingobium marinum]NYH94149.1 PAS domain S-box-containing protein [Novosphingobium marinum]GGC19968.1 signal transduction histidine kinase [Novosphingobium marinum]